MSAREKYENWKEVESHIANLRTAIAVQSFILVMGTMLISNRRSGGELMIAVLFVGYQIFCAFLAKFRYKTACGLVAIPNLVIALSIGFLSGLPRSLDDPWTVLWLVSTGGLGVVATILSRATIPPIDEVQRDIAKHDEVD